MQRFIPADVFLLCFILGSWDKLAAAFDDDELAKEEEQVATFFDTITTLFALLNHDQLKADSAEYLDNTHTLKKAGLRSARSLESLKNPNAMHQYLIVHDWKSSVHEKWIEDASDAISKLNNSAVTGFDWSSTAALGYGHASRAVKEYLGNHLAKHILLENSAGKLDVSKLILIGHGLGAHLSGIAAKRVFQKLDTKVAMIIGVSPSGRNFQHEMASKKLHKDDAFCVAALHTDQENYGYRHPIGGLDFFANGGFIQPGCEINSLCSQKRAGLLIAEAFSKRELMEVEQSKILDFPHQKKLFIRMVRGDCSMGHGSYGFLTRSAPPFL